MSTAVLEKPAITSDDLADETTWILSPIIFHTQRGPVPAHTPRFTDEGIFVMAARPQGDRMPLANVLDAIRRRFMAEMEEAWQAAATEKLAPLVDDLTRKEAVLAAAAQETEYRIVVYEKSVADAKELRLRREPVGHGEMQDALKKVNLCKVSAEKARQEEEELRRSAEELRRNIDEQVPTLVEAEHKAKCAVLQAEKARDTEEILAWASARISRIRERHYLLALGEDVIREAGKRWFRERFQPAITAATGE
jgi:hypothetical protein